MSPMITVLVLIVIVFFPDISSAEFFSDTEWPDFSFDTSDNVAWERLLTPTSITLEQLNMKLFDDDLSFLDLETMDIDNDNDIDLLYGCYSDGMVLAENDDNGTSWSLIYLTSGSGNVRAVSSDDFDLDGDPDPLGFFSNGNLTWYENDSGNFFPRAIGVAEGVDSWGLCTVDLDLDGDIDIISSSSGGLIFWRNNHMTGCFQGISIASDLPSNSSVSFLLAEDLDNDGDNDIVACIENWYGVFVLENLSPTGFNWSIHRVFDGEAHFLTASLIDVDNDGDSDILAHGDKITWFENAGNMQWTPKKISEQPSGYAVAGDLDGDGDIDLAALPSVSSEHPSPVLIWERTGPEEWQSDYFASVLGTSRCLAAVDLDNDGIDDIVMNNKRLIWGDQFAESGFLISQAFSTTPDVEWGYIDWILSPPAANVYFRIRTGEHYNNMGLWSDSIKTPGESLENYVCNPNDSVIQYMACFSNTDTSEQLALEWVSISYNPLGIHGGINPQELVLRTPGNPSTEEISIMINVPEDGDCSLTLYDIRGCLVALLNDGQIGAGMHEFSVFGLNTGTYFARLEFSGETVTSSLVVLE